VSTGRGRRARRTIKVALAPAWIEFAGAAQVAQLRRTVTKKGKKTVEVVYLIISDRDADPATLAAWVRSHWEIEGWLGEIEGLKISLADANDKLAQIDSRGGSRQPVDLGFPAIPPQQQRENTMPVSP
jgi:hypothetical protein